MAFDRVARVLTPLGEGALQLRSMSGHEGLSTPFDFSLDLISEDPALDLNALLGAVVSVELKVPEHGLREFSGHVTELSLVGGEGRFAAYRARVEPWLKLLSYNVDSRVFQHATIPERLPELEVSVTTLFTGESERSAAPLQTLRLPPGQKRVELSFLASLPCHGREQRLLRGVVHCRGARACR